MEVQCDETTTQLSHLGLRSPSELCLAVYIQLLTPTSLFHLYELCDRYIMARLFSVLPRNHNQRLSLKAEVTNHRTHSLDAMAATVNTIDSPSTRVQTAPNMLCTVDLSVPAGFNSTVYVDLSGLSSYKVRPKLIISRYSSAQSVVTLTADFRTSRRLSGVTCDTSFSRTLLSVSIVWPRLLRDADWQGGKKRRNRVVVLGLRQRLELEESRALSYNLGIAFCIVDIFNFGCPDKVPT
ncbi:hypothetical protein RRG08_043674 [Elysia crispata]|uniref:Uncharacterized protein n=1 Tax=Elysia crispata TaxID=231223 RepID=A0AAE0ZUR3_9GAST|nr:hypothetical protein RRG08_043674 [Elysia crispata]